MSDKELANEEARIIGEYNERFRPHPYRQVFFAPAGEWQFDGSYVDGFFQSAKHLLEGIATGLAPDIYGVTAAYVARHYLEIAVKYALFHSRWLKNERQNAANREITAVSKSHDLQFLWNMLVRELKSRTPSIFDTGLDLKFVAKFLKEFDEVDNSGERFRYPTKQIAIGPRTDAVSPSQALDFDALLANLIRAHDILDTLDTYLVETHGENEEWQEIVKNF